MGNLDDIKKKLNIDGLNDKDREKLFKSFVDHGGKAVEFEEEEKRKKRAANRYVKRDSFGSKTGAKTSQRGKSKQASKNSTAKKTAVAKPVKRLTTREDILKSNKASFFQRFGINLFSFFNKVTNFSGTVLNNNFVSQTNMGLVEALLDLQKLSFVILDSQSFQQDFEVKYYFFKKYPISYELLLRLSKLKVKDIIDSIRTKDRSSSTYHMSPTLLEEEITSLFKMLYVFMPYKKKIIESYREGFLILGKKEKLNDTAISTYMTQVQRSVSFVFEKYMVRLFYAFLKASGMNFKINSPGIPIYLSLEESDKIGGMQVDLEKEFESAKEGQGAEDKSNTSQDKENIVDEVEEKLNLSDEVLDGLDIIEKIDFTAFGGQKDSPFYFYDKKDKILRIAAILEFFEREYSFLMTGTKVKYYMEHHEGIKFDPKKDMNEEYVSLTAVMDNIREYSQQIREIVNTEENAHIPAMQKHNLIHKATIQKSKISMGLRAKLSDAINRIKITLEKVKSDYKKFLSDPDKELTFSDMDQKKRLSGRNPVQALDEFYQFVAAFHYLLTKGYLGGAGNVIH